MIKTRTITTYEDEEAGFKFTFMPVEDSLTITKTEQGYEAKYLVLDEDAMPPDEWGDDSIFLVHYHRDCWVENKKVINENDLREWYQGEKISQTKEYRLFPVAALIHSGVWLSLSTNFHEDPGGWDTSHVGAILVSKKEWKSYKKALKAAESLLETWNMYFSGDVYGIVKETYDKNKEQINQESVWGYYGYKYALQALKED